VHQLGHSVITVAVLQLWLGPSRARSSAYVQLHQDRIFSAFGPRPACRPVSLTIGCSWKLLTRSPSTHEGYDKTGYLNTEAFQQSFD